MEGIFFVSGRREYTTVYFVTCCDTLTQIHTHTRFSSYFLFFQVHFTYVYSCSFRSISSFLVRGPSARSSSRTNFLFPTHPPCFLGQLQCFGCLAWERTSAWTPRRRTDRSFLSTRYVCVYTYAYERVWVTCVGVCIHTSVCFSALSLSRFSAVRYKAVPHPSPHPPVSLLLPWYLNGFSLLLLLFQRWWLCFGRVSSQRDTLLLVTIWDNWTTGREGASMVQMTMYISAAYFAGSRFPEWDHGATSTQTLPST